MRTLNKSSHTKKCLETYLMILVYTHNYTRIYIDIYIYTICIYINILYTVKKDKNAGVLKYYLLLFFFILLEMYGWLEQERGGDG